jgi:predicted nucleic acid-binding protein
MTDFLTMTVQQVEGLPEAKAAEVLDAWVKAKKADLPQALTQSNSKPHAKLAKKALYRLQSSGVKVEAPREEGAAPVTTEATKTEFPGVLSMQLGSGERAFFFAVPVAGGGLEAYNGILHDEFGLAQIATQRTNRNTYRKRLAELERDPEARVMVVPFERIQLELGRAMTLNARTKHDYDAEIAQSLERAGLTPKDPDVVIPKLEATDAAGVEDGAALHELFEIKQWMPSEKDLEVLTQRVDAIRNGPLPLSDAQKEEKCVALAKELCAEAFTPAVRQLYARRLLYTAEVLDFQERAADAARVRAEARRLAHTTTTSRFAEQLFVKVLSTIAPKK